ncbi:hypothetical protein ABXN37_07855 [Piscinibacter sakaiensis]|uniref:Uncharacterized protein n=1 Tax=Piscinibacter sakaiensis TaxID=1547922 RepID=A0A0K8NXG1_PISS1|nr:hypothetical protein [Piscinibacter sakaiensis]GAP35066.1 hypothetical protein ISF6_0631 [Piscinibacter sakaiensis]
MSDNDTPAALGAVHRRRLREVWRSAGWPSQDLVEVELLAAGWLERVEQADGRHTVRVTPQGVQVLAQTLQRHRGAYAAHESLVQRVADEMLRHGRLAWRGLSLRCKPLADGPWVMAMPDVYSVRHTTVEAYLAPVVHEVKVRRADLLADLNRPAKRAAYLQLGGECWYVLAEGIADPAEVPAECGVMLARPLPDGGWGALDIVRTAPRRAFAMHFGLWMALARATPLPGWRPDDDQPALSACDDA